MLWRSPVSLEQTRRECLTWREDCHKVGHAEYPRILDWCTNPFMGNLGECPGSRLPLAKGRIPITMDVAEQWETTYKDDRECRVHPQIITFLYSSQYPELNMAGDGKITTSEGSTESGSPRRAVDYAHIPRRKYFASAQGRALRAQIAIAGSIGFLLFGYDQGVLGVSMALMKSPSTAEDS